MHLLRASILSLCLCLGAPAFAQSAQAQDAAPSAGPTALDVARANMARMRAQPRWISGPDADFPDSEKALGHNGAVMVRGILGVDGKLTNAEIAESSGAPVLDANALKAAQEQLFEPAKDEAGAPIAIVFHVPFRFDNYRSAEGVGAARYGCRQFVLDMDWWKQTFPDQPFSKHEFNAMMRGLGMVARMGQGQTTMAMLAAANKDFDRRWNAAIEACRARPDLRFADVMHPEGDYILNLERHSQAKPN